jgi:hypothetical protein
MCLFVSYSYSYAIDPLVALIFLLGFAFRDRWPIVGPAVDLNHSKELGNFDATHFLRTGDIFGLFLQL